jgi:hypothetical protein
VTFCLLVLFPFTTVAHSVPASPFPCSLDIFQLRNKNFSPKAVRRLESKPDATGQPLMQKREKQKTEFIDCENARSENP